jgi:hypothetical protein
MNVIDLRNSTTGFNRKDFGIDVTITKPGKAVKSFTLYYPFCYELMDQFIQSSCVESLQINGYVLSADTMDMYALPR